jgi:glucose/arabinose dehydrogenase
VTVVVAAGNGAAPLDVPRTLTVPAGTVVTAWARIPGARFAIWTPQGDLLVSTPGAGSVQRVHPEASGNPTITTVVAGLDRPHGMAFDTIEGKTYLYVIETGQLDRYDWNGTSIGARAVLVTGLPGTGSYSHPAKAVVVGPDHTIYLDVASSSNADPADRSQGEALIASYRPDGTGRRVLMVGVRNGDGLAFAPDGQLWVAVNQRDRVNYPIHGAFGGLADAYGTFVESYGNDHPTDQIVKVLPGRDLGWPYCNPDQDLSTGSDLLASMRFRADTETNANGQNLDCASLTPVERGIAAHSAPLGLEFLGKSTVPQPWRGGAVVATHGSNNHVPPLAGSVLWMAFSEGTLAPAQDLLTGFEADGNRWGRPVDAVPGPDGALYVTDDTAGVIYQVTLGSTR